MLCLRVEQTIWETEQKYLFSFLNCCTDSNVSEGYLPVCNVKSPSLMIIFTLVEFLITL